MQKEKHNMVIAGKEVNQLLKIDPISQKLKQLNWKPKHSPLVIPTHRCRKEVIYIYHTHPNIYVYIHTHTQS